MVLWYGDDVTTLKRNINSLLPYRPSTLVIDTAGEAGDYANNGYKVNALRNEGILLSNQNIFLAAQGTLGEPFRREFNAIWMLSCLLMKKDSPALLPEKSPEQNHGSIMPMRFLCLGGFPRLHKIEFMAELHVRGFLSQIAWSAGTPDPAIQELGWGNYHAQYKKRGYAEDEINQVESFLPLLPHVIDQDTGLVKQGPLGFDEQLFQRGRLHIILESDSSLSVDPPFCRIVLRYTEKTLKSIYYGSPFLIYGSSGTLELLRTHGFRTFHPYINETYNTLSTRREIKAALVQEIHRLLSMNEQKFEKLMQKLKPITNYNREWLVSTEFTNVVRAQSLYAYGLDEKPAFDYNDLYKFLSKIKARGNCFTI